MSRSAEAPVSLRRDERGATTVEFSLIGLLLIALILGTIQIGALLQARNEVSHALSETVRRVHLDPNLTQAAIEAELRTILAADAALDVCVEPVSGTSIMRIVVVRPFTLSIPLLAARDVQIRMETIAPRITNDLADTTDTCG